MFTHLEPTQMLFTVDKIDSLCVPGRNKHPKSKLNQTLFYPHRRNRKAIGTLANTGELAIFQTDDSNDSCYLVFCRLETIPFER